MKYLHVLFYPFRKEVYFQNHDVDIPISQDLNGQLKQGGAPKLVMKKNSFVLIYVVKHLLSKSSTAALKEYILKGLIMIFP